MPQSNSATNFVMYRILYVALFASTWIYLLVFKLVGSATETSAPADPVLAYAFAFVSIGVAAASIVVPKVLMSSAFGQVKPTFVERDDPNAGGIFHDQAVKRRVFANPAAMRATALRIGFAPFVLRLALLESIALFGLVLGLLGHGWSVVLPFFAVTWLLFLVRFPRESALYAEAERQLGASFE